MLSSPMARASWSVGPFSMSPVLFAGIITAKVTVQDLLAQTPFGLGTIDVVAASPLGPRLLAAFPTGTTISRVGMSFDINAHMIPRGQIYHEADQLPFLEILGANLPDTLLAALPGRPLSCLIEASLLPLREVDPPIATAGVTWQSGVAILRVTLEMGWISVVR